MYDQIISPRTISSSIEMPESGYNSIAMENENKIQAFHVEVMYIMYDMVIFNNMGKSHDKMSINLRLQNVTITLK